MMTYLNRLVMHFEALTLKLYDPENRISVGDVLVTLLSYDKNACQKQLQEGTILICIFCQSLVLGSIKSGSLSRQSLMAAGTCR